MYNDIKTVAVIVVTHSTLHRPEEERQRDGGHR